MASAAARLQDKTDSKDFADLLAESLKGQSSFTGSVVNGTVVSVTSDFAIVDVGLKSEGRIPLQEFSRPGEDAEIKIGDVVAELESETSLVECLRADGGTCTLLPDCRLTGRLIGARQRFLEELNRSVLSDIAHRIDIPAD